MADDLGEKTEQPTPQRLQKARERGQAAKSQDLTSAVTMLVSLSLIIVLGGGIAQRLGGLMQRVLGGQTAGNQVSPGSAGAAITYAFHEMVVSLVPVFAILFIVVAAAQFAQVGWLVSTEPIRPKLSKLDPVKGVKKLFDKRNAVKSVVNILKLAVAITVTTIVISINLAEIVNLPTLEALPGVAALLGMVLELALWLLALLIVLGVVDLIFQRWQHKQDLRMTKHEVSDERKGLEGDPQLKNRRLKMAADIATQRIQQAVPDADVIVTNPTHFSVAIKYDNSEMAAPRVVASGVDHMAMRIRHLAILNNIPMVERPPLARALYYGVRPGQDIPPQHFEAVAEILAYVYRLNGQAAQYETAEQETAGVAS